MFKKYLLTATSALILGTALAAQTQPATSTDTNRSAASEQVARQPVQTENNNWGWVGLLGLAGLTGLRRRNEREDYDRNRVRNIPERERKVA
jgi:MYXO-CTERM domain-containing protein